MMALVDTGSQISALTERFYTEIGLWILPLGDLMGSVLHLKGMGGISIPYRGYVETNLTTPDLPGYNEDMLSLVMMDHIYEKEYLWK